MSTAPKQQAKAQQPAASERSQPAQAQPARTAAASDALVILNWKNFSKGALVGFFDLVIANGMILVDCKLFAKGDARWVGWPNRKTTGKDGTDVYIPYVKFISRDHADRMRIECWRRWTLTPKWPRRGMRRADPDRRHRSRTERTTPTSPTTCGDSSEEKNGIRESGNGEGMDAGRRSGVCCADECWRDAAASGNSDVSAVWMRFREGAEICDGRRDDDGRGSGLQADKGEAGCWTGEGTAETRLRWGFSSEKWGVERFSGAG